MKKLMTTLVILLFLVGCKKEENPVPDNYSGTGFASLNGVKWTALSSIAQNNHFPGSYILSFSVFNNDGFQREGMILYKLKPNFDKQFIFMTQIDELPDSLGILYTTITDDGDVVGDIYDLDTTETNNFIQLTNYDSDKSEIEGIFEVALVLNRAGGDSVNPPEKLVFTEGKFKVKVEREWFE